MVTNPNPKAHLAKYAFKKGQSGNPGGRRKNEVSQDVGKATLYDMWHSTIDQLVAIAKNPETKAGERMIAVAFLEANKGKVPALELLLDRIFGKVKSSIDIDIEHRSIAIEQTLDRIPREKIVQLIKDANSNSAA